MTFKAKMDDKKISVDLDLTTIKDVLQYCKPKEQLVLFKKFWLSWNKEIPLQKIWNDYWLTRERVRQIESQWLMKFRRLIVWNERYIKLIKEATKLLKSNWWILSEDNLISKLINKWNLDFRSEEIKLVLVSDFDLYYLKRNKILKKSFYLDPIFEDLLEKISKYCVEYFEKKWDSEDVYNFVDILKKHFENKYWNIEYIQNNVFYINLFKLIKWISVFDGKIWLDSFISVNPKTIKQKIEYILEKENNPLHYQDISSKIIDWFNKPVKVNTVHNELVKNSNIFVNMWLWIYWLSKWWYKWWTVKEIIERILLTSNRQMTIKEITKEVLKEKMISPNTIILTLQKHQDIFHRVWKWMYQIKK